MLTLVRIGWLENQNTSRIEDVLNYALEGTPHEIFSSAESFIQALKKKEWNGNQLLFAVNLSLSGICLDCQRLIGYLVESRSGLEGAAGGILIDGKGELFTKSLARQLAFAVNSAGCALPGRSLVEATGELYNFNVVSRINHVSHLDAYKINTRDLVRRLTKFHLNPFKRPNILGIHAGNSTTSNTILLWEMVKRGLWDKSAITEISLRNGTVVDCSGCSYETCRHFGEQGSCLYGGVMVQKVYPAILNCNELVMICPNYNDAVSANITAFINRLTALFRTNDFSQKRVYALVVSGYSGGDIVTEQILGAMCFNKNFILPPKFALVETANDPGSILERERIQSRAAAMSERMLE